MSFEFRDLIIKAVCIRRTIEEEEEDKEDKEEDIFYFAYALFVSFFSLYKALRSLVFFDQFFSLHQLRENPKNHSLMDFFFRSRRLLKNLHTTQRKMVQLEIPLSFPRGPVRLLPSSFSL